MTRAWVTFDLSWKSPQLAELQMAYSICGLQLTGTATILERRIDTVVFDGTTAHRIARF
jgi:hypothetical protein